MPFPFLPPSSSWQEFLRDSFHSLRDSIQILNQRPWFIPACIGGGMAFLALAAIILVMSGTLIIHPATSPIPIFSINPTPVEAMVGQTKFAVPGNHLREVRRQNGETTLHLHFLWPGLLAYGPMTRGLFEGPVRRNSPVIEVELSAPGLTFASSRRMEALYKPLIEPEAEGEEAGGLTLYRFSDEADAPAHQQIFTGHDERDNFAVVFCFREDWVAIAPSCRRSFLLDDGLAVTYFFKRVHLADWQEIGTALRARIEEMRLPGPRG